MSAYKPPRKHQRRWKTKLGLNRKRPPRETPAQLSARARKLAENSNDAFRRAHWEGVAKAWDLIASGES